MSITDKTRKILWTQSGNRCAICRRELVVAATKVAEAAVIGEECHIVARESSAGRGIIRFPWTSVTSLIISFCSVVITTKSR